MLLIICGVVATYTNTYDICEWVMVLNMTEEACILHFWAGTSCRYCETMLVVSTFIIVPYLYIMWCIGKILNNIFSYIECHRLSGASEPLGHLLHSKEDLRLRVMYCTVCIHVYDLTVAGSDILLVILVVSSGVCCGKLCLLQTESTTHSVMSVTLLLQFKFVWNVSQFAFLFCREFLPSQLLMFISF